VLLRISDDVRVVNKRQGRVALAIEFDRAKSLELEEAVKSGALAEYKVASLTVEGPFVQRLRLHFHGASRRYEAVILLHNQFESKWLELIQISGFVKGLQSSNQPLRASGRFTTTLRNAWRFGRLTPLKPVASASVPLRELSVANGNPTR
jgi:hypothetical protein